MERHVDYDTNAVEDKIAESVIQNYDESAKEALVIGELVRA